MNEYEEQQRIRDAEYEAAWKNLTPAKRKQMAKLGITGPEKPNYNIGKTDEETYIVKSAAMDSVREDGECEEDNALQSGSNDSTWAVLRRLVALIRAQNKIQLSIDCFALVSGMQYDGESMATIARRHGVTRAAVSKRCVELTETLGLKPAAGMRRLTTRQRYGRRARKCHHRSAH